MTPTHKQLWEWLTPKRMMRLFSKIEMQAGEMDCWLWTGAKTNDYGQAYLTIEGEECGVPVHRLLMVLCYGRDFPEDVPIARHYVCGNTFCCNPRHTLAGTEDDNWDDQMMDDTPERRQMISQHKADKRNKALDWLRDKQARERVE
jgi:hypothetical protein